MKLLRRKQEKEREKQRGMNTRDRQASICHSHVGLLAFCYALLKTGPSSYKPPEHIVNVPQCHKDILPLPHPPPTISSAFHHDRSHKPHGWLGRSVKDCTVQSRKIDLHINYRAAGVFFLPDWRSQEKLLGYSHGIFFTTLGKNPCRLRSQSMACVSCSAVLLNASMMSPVWAAEPERQGWKRERERARVRRAEREKDKKLKRETDRERKSKGKGVGEKTGVSENKREKQKGGRIGGQREIGRENDSGMRKQRGKTTDREREMKRARLRETGRKGTKRKKNKTKKEKDSKEVNEKKKVRKMKSKMVGKEHLGGKMGMRQKRGNERETKAIALSHTIHPK